MSKWADRISLGLLLVAAVVVVGCEFESSGDGDSFNTSGFSWVNFSGVYKGANGGVLVTDFSTGTGVEATNTVNVQTVNNEGIGVGDGAKTAFSGFLNHDSVVVGSVSITAGGFNLKDNSDGTLSGSGASGSIDYGTGAWSIDLQGFPLGDNVGITADYQYNANSGTGGGGGGDDDGAGSSGKAIFSFSVFQAGNKLEITDNNGAKYTGQLGKVATTSGLDDTNEPGVTPSVGDSAIAEYTVRGTSAAGKSVLMTGTFQGVVSRGANSLFFSDRRMLGTWVEANGVTGDINGSASPIGINSVNPTVAP